MSTSAKAALLEEYALIAQALAAPARLALLEQLAQGPRGVDGLAQKTALSVANASQHLQALRRAGLVTSQREGTAVIYALADPETLALLDLLHRVAGRNRAQVEHILRGLAEGTDPPEPLDRDALQARLAEGSVTLLDIRPADEFAAAHIPGARNVPLGEIAAVIATLDPQAEIVAYCRGPYCVFAHKAVAVLRKHGLDARRMQGGLPEWRAEGRAVVSAR